MPAIRQTVVDDEDAHRIAAPAQHRAGDGDRRLGFGRRVLRQHVGPLFAQERLISAEEKRSKRVVRVLAASTCCMIGARFVEQLAV